MFLQSINLKYYYIVSLKYCDSDIICVFALYACTYDFLTKYFKKTQGESIILGDKESHKTMRLNFREADKQRNIVCNIVCNLASAYSQKTG